MVTPMPPSLSRRSLSDLEILDAESFAHVGVWRDLRDVLERSDHTFLVLEGPRATYDRALALNLTYWSAAEGGDVLPEARIDADVVAHAAWHHLASRAMPARDGRASVESMFVGEAIASAFDVYLVGRLLGHATESSFLESQVPLMTDTAAAAGATDDEIERLLGAIADDPDAAFASLYALLMDATSAMFSAADAATAARALASLDGSPTSALLHRFELSNWVLYARAYGDPAPDPRARAVDEAIRAARAPVDWLDDAWVQAALSSTDERRDAAPKRRRR